MIERARGFSRVVPILLILALALAWQAPDLSWLRAATTGPHGADPMTSALDTLPDEPLVLIGFDADVGTYAEIRPTVRALLADLLARDGRLAFVSLTPEGRALASAEIARLRRGEANPTRLLDLGFIPGAEAGLVDLTRDIRVDSGDDGVFAREVEGAGIAAVDAILVIGGNDLGPRSWIEQVIPRIADVPLLTVTPTVLLPEVQPYLAGGQLAAGLITPGDGASYRQGLELGNLERLIEPTEPRQLPILVGMLVAVTVLGHALASRALARVRSAASRSVG
ncbi:MAG: hypothetical protein M3406_04810 [Chloroflexota bacterium]|nr:hypothetical protein [Chloroflexota bacterium]